MKPIVCNTTLNHHHNNNNNNNTTTTKDIIGPPSKRSLHRESVFVRRRFVSAPQLVRRILAMPGVCEENFLDCVLEDSFVDEACRAFSEAMKDESLRDPMRFVESYERCLGGESR